MTTTLTPAVHHLGSRTRCAMCNGQVFTWAEERNEAGETIRKFCPSCARKREAGALVAGDRVTFAGEPDPTADIPLPASTGVVTGYVTETRYQVREDGTGREFYADRDELDRMD